MKGKARGERIEGMSAGAQRALDRFSSALSAVYSSELNNVFVFGSRARGNAANDSDLDVVVVLKDDGLDHFTERMKLADLAYDVIVETGIHLQPWPVTIGEWENPETHRNPALVWAMKRDAIRADAQLD